MNSFLARLFLLLLLLFSLVYAHKRDGFHTLGAVTADTYTFEKLLDKFDVVLAKFDDKFPFGEKHNQFKNLAERIGASRNFLLVEILLVENDERENGELGKRYGVRNVDYPVYRLFLNGSTTAINYNGPKTEADLERFILKHADVRFSLPGTVWELDSLAARFYEAASNQNLPLAENFISETKTIVNSLTYSKDQKQAEIYVKIMETTLEKGSDFIVKEQKRISKLLQGKVSSEKKFALQDRFNILLSFNPIKPTGRHPVGEKATQFINVDPPE